VSGSNANSFPGRTSKQLVHSSLAIHPSTSAEATQICFQEQFRVIHSSLHVSGSNAGSTPGTVSRNKHSGNESQVLSSNSFPGTIPRDSFIHPSQPFLTEFFSAHMVIIASGLSALFPTGSHKRGQFMTGGQRSCTAGATLLSTGHEPPTVQSN
jgi:hypothetical protein